MSAKADCVPCCPTCHRPMALKPKRICSRCKQPIGKHDKFTFERWRVQHRDCARPGDYPWWHS